MPSGRYRIFVSSVQKELAAERRAVKDFITRDPLLSRFVSEVFLFEDIPASGRKPDNIYLAERRSIAFIFSAPKSSSPSPPSNRMRAGCSK